MAARFHKLPLELKSVPGATKAAVDDLVARLGYDLPDDYLQFMRTSNGAEGAMSESSYLVIWPVEEVISLNEANAVQDFATQLLLFGSDSGSRGYAFDIGSPGMPIVSVDLILTEVIEQMGSNLSEFFQMLAGDP